MRGDKMIVREKYLKEIRPFYDVDLIKVIVGIRRCGKSVILTQIMDEIKKKKVKNENIIYVNFESKQYSYLLTDDALYQFVKEKIKNKEKYYIFFDEIQMVDRWELAINSLKAEYGLKISMFLTGSNSDLLSSELATHIAGRYVSFQVYPFTFMEVCEIKNLKGKNKYELQDAFDEYMLWGGMPQRFSIEGESSMRAYLLDVYNSIVVKDIMERFHIKELDLFQRIIEYVVTTPAQVFSAHSLAKYFESSNRVVAKNTLYNYLEYMCKALLIHKVNRYDIRGKRILTGKYKYYLTDLGLGQVMNTSRKLQLGAYLENIVYNELLSRGYDITIGSLENGEVDFIAMKGKEKLYFQVAYKLTDDIIDRKFNVYNNINDHYPKYVLSTDTFDFSQNGIIHKNIIDWLLEK